MIPIGTVRVSPNGLVAVKTDSGDQWLVAEDPTGNYWRGSGQVEDWEEVYRPDVAVGTVMKVATPSGWAVAVRIESGWRSVFSDDEPDGYGGPVGDLWAVLS
jgi:hypothetical protein